MPGKHWTEEEINFLYEYWGNWSVDTMRKELKKRFGREIKNCTIESKLYHMGLGSAILHGDWITTGDVARILSLDYTTVIKWTQQGKFPGKRIKLRSRTMHLVKFDTFIDWLKNNPYMWDSKKVELFALGSEPDWLKQKRKYDATHKFKPFRVKRKEKKQPRSIDEKTILEIKNLHDNGLSYRQIAKQFYVSKETVYRACKKYYKEIAV